MGPPKKRISFQDFPEMLKKIQKMDKSEYTLQRSITYPTKRVPAGKMIDSKVSLKADMLISDFGNSTSMERHGRSLPSLGMLRASAMVNSFVDIGHGSVTRVLEQQLGNSKLTQQDGGKPASRNEIDRWAKLTH